MFKINNLIRVISYTMVCCRQNQRQALCLEPVCNFLYDEHIAFIKKFEEFTLKERIQPQVDDE